MLPGRIDQLVGNSVDLDESEECGAELAARGDHRLRQQRYVEGTHQFDALRDIDGYVGIELLGEPHALLSGGERKCTVRNATLGGHVTTRHSFDHLVRPLSRSGGGTNPPATEETHSDLRTWELTEHYPGVRFRFLSDIRFGPFHGVSQCGHRAGLPTWILFPGHRYSTAPLLPGRNGAAVGAEP